MPGVKTRTRGRSVPGTLPRQWISDIDDYCNALAWSPSGDQLAAAAISGPIMLFDGATGTRHAALPGHGLGTTALAWHPDGSILASAGQDGQVRLWDARASGEVLSLPAGAPWCERVAWSPAGDLLASAAGRVLRLWDREGTLVREYTDHPSTIADIQWRPGGRKLAAAVYGGVILRDADQPEALRRFEWKGSSLMLAWSPACTYIATGEQDSTVHFWNVETGSDLQMWGYEAKVLQLAWNHTGRYLATGGGPAVVIWDCSGKGPEGTTPQMLKGNRAPISALAYQPDGTLLATGSADGRVALWRTEKAKGAALGAKIDAGVAHLAWAPHGRQFAAGAESGTIAVFATQ